MGSLQLCFAALLTLACSSLAQAQAQPSGAESVEYRQTVDAALEEYELNHFMEARNLFQRAHQLSPSARTLRGLGMVEFELRHYVGARQLLEASLEDARKPLTESQRRAVHDLLIRTEQFVGRVELSVESASEVKMELDGQAVVLDAQRGLTLPTGEHTLVLRAPGMQEESLRLDVKGAEQRTVNISLKPLAIPTVTTSVASTVAKTTHLERPYRTVAITLLSAGAAMAAAGAAVGGLAYMEAKASEGEGDPDNDHSHGMAIGADVALGVGVLCAATGLGLLLVRRERGDASSAAQRLRIDSSLARPRAGFDASGSSLQVRF